MPAIPASDRPRVRVEGPAPGKVGELTYALTSICTQYLPPDYRYADLAEVIAALEVTKLEFARNVLTPYEDAKAQENGTVY